MHASCALLGTVGSAGHVMYNLWSSSALCMAALCRRARLTLLSDLEQRLWGSDSPEMQPGHVSVPLGSTLIDWQAFGEEQILTIILAGNRLVLAVHCIGQESLILDKHRSLTRP